MGFDSPAKAAGTMNAWPEIVSQQGHLAMVAVTAIGAWGYLAITTLASVGFELTLRNLNEAFAMLAASVGELFGDDDGAVDDAEAVARGIPRVAGAAESDQPDQQVQATPGTTDQPSQVPIPNVVLGDVPGPHSEPPDQRHRPGSRRPARGERPRPIEELLDEDRGAPAHNRPAATRQDPVRHAGRDNADQLRRVVGGNGEHVTFTDAVRDAAKYYVQPETGTIYDREYWEQLHAEPIAA
jgi:hypothetical protein